MFKTMTIAAAGAAGLLIAWSSAPDTLREAAGPVTVCAAGVELTLGVETPVNVSLRESLACGGCATCQPRLFGFAWKTALERLTETAL